MSPSRRARWAVLGTVLSTVAVLMLAGTAPAAAHDQLISSSPARDEHLAEPPSEVILTFSDDVLAFEGVGAVIRISDSAGGTWQRGAVTTAGAVVRSAVSPDMPDGAYTLAWQVVSADGHTVSGVIPFTVGDATAAAAEPAPSARPATAAPDPAPSFPPVLRTALIGVAGALVALLLWALYRLIRRPSTREHQ